MIIRKKSPILQRMQSIRSGKSSISLNSHKKPRKKTMISYSNIDKDPQRENLGLKNNQSKRSAMNSSTNEKNGRKKSLSARVKEVNKKKSNGKKSDKRGIKRRSKRRRKRRSKRKRPSIVVRIILV